jgi:CDP-glucose 4,6-dehydratase
VEDNPLRGEYPYDVSKSCTDLISSCFARTYGMGVGITRCGNLFGGGDFNFSRMLPGLIQSTLRGERFVIRSDGKFIRDFLYVKDAVSAYLTFAEQLAEKPELRGEAFNFSMEVRVSVLELVNLTLKVMNRADLEPVIRNEASSEIREQYLTCEKARRLLGWQASYDLEQGVRETVDWYTKYFRGNALSASA